MTLLDRNRIPCGSVKGWRDQATDTLIQYSCRESWESFYLRVRSFYQSNALVPPDEAAVEDAICRQIPKSWCGDPAMRNVRVLNHQRPPPVAGCSRCGKKK